MLGVTREAGSRTRTPEAGSVQLQEWPELPALERDKALVIRHTALRALRAQVTEAIAPLRREKQVRSSLEAEITMNDLNAILQDLDRNHLAEAFISGTVHLVPGHDGITIAPTTDHKCGRCWRHLPEVTEDGSLCNRCETVLDAA